MAQASLEGGRWPCLLVPLWRPEKTDALQAMSEKELPIRPDRRHRLRLVLCPLHNRQVSLGKCYRCKYYLSGPGAGKATVSCAR